MKDRLDKVLNDRGLVSSRSQAKSLIEKGEVLVNGLIVKRAADLVSLEDVIEVTAPAFVGRGAFKLVKALEEFKVDVKDLIMLDVGSSTGGFTEVLLLQGARKIYAIDVGTDQLAPKLKADSRVVSMEGTNIRELVSLPEKASGAVVDLSFVSVTKTLQSISLLLEDKGFAIILIKPQFEAGLDRLPKDGVVKDPKVRELIRNEVHAYASSHGWTVSGSIVSPIEGKNGNVEFLSLLVKN